MVVHDVQDEYAFRLHSHHQAMRMFDGDSKDSFSLLFELMEAGKAVKFLAVQLLDLVNQCVDRLREMAILLLQAFSILKQLLEMRLFKTDLHSNFCC